MANSSVITMKVPDISSLINFKCQPKLEKIMNSTCKTDYHANVLTSRYIINCVPDVIAAPNKLYFNVIVKNDTRQINKLKIFLKDIHVDYSNPERVKLENYQKCLQYTIEFKMGSLWNRVGKYLIYGKKFLQNNIGEMKPALSINYKILSDEMHIQITQLNIQQHPLKLEEIFDSKIVEEFLSNPKGVLDITNLKRIPIYIHVIPSLQRAELVLISKEIPKDCPFETYEDIYKHWKNMYGYLLPKKESEIFYCTVVFPYFDKKKLTYPNVCVFEMPPKIHSRGINPKDDLNAQFYDELEQSVLNICGEKIDLISGLMKRSNLNDISSLNSTLSNQWSNVKQVNLDEPASEKFTFEIQRLNPVKDENTASQNIIDVDAASNHRPEISETKVINPFYLARQNRNSLIPMGTNSSLKRSTYKSIIPNAPHISTYFKDNEFKITNVKGLKKGDEINRKYSDKNTRKEGESSRAQLPRSTKPLFSSEELTRKNI